MDDVKTRVIDSNKLINAINQGSYDINLSAVMELGAVMAATQPEITKEYNLKKIYNIYVKIAQAHFLYQPSKPKTITAMPFDWIEVQNLLEKYLEDHGADFDALCREYVSENAKDDHLLSAQPEQRWIPCDETMEIPDHEVLACDKRGEMIIGYLAYYNEQWICESETEILYNPVAWMEKPQPYKGGQDGQ